MKKLNGMVFNSKRAEMKQRHPKTSDPQFPFAKPKLFNLPTNEVPLPLGTHSHMELIFFSDFTNLNPFTLSALVSKERGIKNHPYWTGSGDHVNSQMQLDMYRQFGFGLCYKMGLWAPNATLALAALKEISYRHYVEFDSVFELEYAGHSIHPIASFCPYDKTEIGMPCSEWATDKFVLVSTMLFRPF